MIISIEKFQQLWKQQVPLQPLITQRAEQIYKILQRWDGARDSILAIKDSGNPVDEEIPTNSWSAVKVNLKNFYESRPELKNCVEQVEEISGFLHLQNREERFRVSSNAKSGLPYENHDISPNNFCNPETHFASFNFPFEIIKFLFSCKEPAISVTLHHPADHRFIPKFIWMLANRENVIPILSLQSFRELSPLFRELVENVDWGDRDDRWALSLSDFVNVWSEVSNRLCRMITGEDYLALTEEKKRSLAELLFVASVSHTTTKNAFDMIETGNKAIILYGPPGTGKTYIARDVAKQKLMPKQNADDAGLQGDVTHDVGTWFNDCNFTKKFGDSIPTEWPKLTHGCWEIIQFHPSYTYHDFIGGIMPDLKSEELRYTKKEGIFKRFCDAARVNLNYPFIMIIDEINRADLSSVFGELMYAIEYRGEPVNTLQFGQFVIPNNVYIIGTMNTTDKSLVTFDLALRRRFLFMKLKPDLSKLHDWNSDAGKSPPSIKAAELSALITSGDKLNISLVAKPPDGLGLDEDYAIGHAYFMKIRDFCDEDAGLLHITEFAREKLWDYHLEPLIEEYLGAEAKTHKLVIEELRKQFTTHEQIAE